jgi:hypothetical protein
MKALTDKCNYNEHFVEEVEILKMRRCPIRDNVYLIKFNKNEVAFGYLNRGWDNNGNRIEYISYKEKFHRKNIPIWF